MPRLSFPSVPPNSPAQPSPNFTSETPSKETSKKSLLRSLSSRSRAFLSSSSPTGRNSPRKTQTPSPILRGFSESLAKIPNILPKSPLLPRSPKAQTPQHRRTYTLSTLRKTQTLDPMLHASQDFELISISEPEALFEARLHLKRVSTDSGTADGRLSMSPSISGNYIPFPKLSPPGPQHKKTASFRQTNKSSDNPRENSGRESKQAASFVPEEGNTVPRNALHNREDTTDRLLHIARFLQKAARHARDEGAYSQQSVFQASAPLVLFVFVLGIGVLLPRYYSALQRRFGSGLQTYFLLLLLGGASVILISLRATIWVMSMLGNSFCEMDLAAFSRQGECIAADGTRMGEGELVLWSFLFG